MNNKVEKIITNFLLSSGKKLVIKEGIISLILSGLSKIPKNGYRAPKIDSEKPVIFNKKVNLVDFSSFDK